MKKFLAGLLAAAFIATGLSGFLISQEAQKSYTCSFNGGMGIGTFIGVTVDQVKIAIVTLSLMPESNMKLNLIEPFQGNLCILTRCRSEQFYLTLILAQKGSDTRVGCGICPKIGHGPDPQSLEEAGGIVGTAIQETSRLEWVHKVEKAFYVALASVLRDQTRN